ncbi:MAG: hypothetical protein M1837_001184 [Sclerophora amabilis]|nr:MAG: hypothetical protein M1837_001184 [Sclerophora amabilis]
MSVVPRSLSVPLLGISNYFRSHVGSITWGPLVQISRSAVCSLFTGIEKGQLLVTDVDGSVLQFGEKSQGDRQDAELFIRNEALWVRMLLFADMGFAESYMLGEVDCPNLTTFFELFIDNRSQLSDATTLTSSIMSTVTSLARSTNTMSNSRLNVSAHYDISNEMFAAFLSDDMTYSCPVWSRKSSEKALTESLEDAQLRKLHRFIFNAKIRGTDHVLEIGTGWGSLAIEAVRTTGCKVTSATLSVEQKMLAEKRINAAGLADHIDVILCDYRALPTPKVLYDKVVSIEMLEAVGREYLQTYFACVDRLLKPQGGIAVFQCITMPESRYEAYSKGEDFIRKYIFPGGHLPTVSQLVESINKGSNGTLVIDRIENIGGHYAKTLRLWNQKFMQNFEARIRPALLDEHPEMTYRDADLFRRKWEYYFMYCQAGFSTKTLGDVIITAGREGATDMLEDIPM